MGCGASKDNSIDKQIVEMAKSKPITIMLLGSGESGKSTIAKQLKILFGGGFTQNECSSYKTSICTNVVTCMRTLIEQAGILNHPLTYKPTSKEFTTEDPVALPFSPELVGDVEALWADAGIQATFEESSKFQIPDCAKYLFENVKRIATDDYIPTEEDLIHNRTKTTGIHEYDFTVKDIPFHLIDVGGQRSERKKWVSFFSDVDCAIFVTSLAEYDMKLYEDGNTSRLTESVAVFKDIMTNEFLKNAVKLIFLNKMDLFEEKLTKTALNVIFPDYTGGDNSVMGAQYIQQLFTGKLQAEEMVVSGAETGNIEGAVSEKVYTNLTNATDGSNIKRVFMLAVDVIMKNMAANGKMRPQK
ncbi:guanine nucleotide-binding protein alpha-1 subunit, putative [Entamoeba invadens IP1]|uniref:Guanine nucleotide-binding protein alpha-1 subunit, putative n=2 Tax=Entamoeba invadens TaxID=33085 RepID=L7FK44_ENTIV|nr:guanine nucleotide-binding protein alpha-1 subunit, putative [Entamoeba invadens IP1]ELP83990.1 guanine nucleotide-binding protein alpha-1 subunit, putative [Entamoeba invadens IP1]BAN40864.1 guanine nucleotide-binding protein alpha-1 subunit, putative [Entamoeba invadens]BAN41508.1 guanine nucleotide-binding protein alpha-1 subunit, putative [Entamoeba invadens]|eukprot:XP_004183336.1 guanine nucleotide-binding protein alpha-1 subunit, putative [Entamoeba invadens IP1]